MSKSCLHLPFSIDPYITIRRMDETRELDTVGEYSVHCKSRCYEEISASSISRIAQLSLFQSIQSTMTAYLAVSEKSHEEYAL